MTDMEMAQFLGEIKGQLGQIQADIKNFNEKMVDAKMDAKALQLKDVELDAKIAKHALVFERIEGKFRSQTALCAGVAIGSGLTSGGVVAAVRYLLGG